MGKIYIFTLTIQYFAYSFSVLLKKKDVKMHNNAFSDNFLGHLVLKSNGNWALRQRRSCVGAKNYFVIIYTKASLIFIKDTLKRFMNYCVVINLWKKNKHILQISTLYFLTLSIYATPCTQDFHTGLDPTLNRVPPYSSYVYHQYILLLLNKQESVFFMLEKKSILLTLRMSKIHL